MMKKDKGEAISTVLEAMVGAILLSLLLSIVFVYGNQLLIYTRISHVSRDYIQKMEIYGCLTPELENELIAELTDLGLQNINCQNSTLIEEENGEPIVLDIRADMKYTAFIVDGFVKKQTDDYAFQISRTSISKTY